MRAFCKFISYFFTLCLSSCVAFDYWLREKIIVIE